MRQIQGYNYFSKFDCKSGFHQLKLTEESKQLTAFKVPNGFYELLKQLELRQSLIEFEQLIISI